MTCKDTLDPTGKDTASYGSLPYLYKETASYDSLLVISRKRALQLVALLRKETYNLRHPMHLRHPVDTRREIQGGEDP